uniref:Uncharacterized protein n=1 Tax=Arundo donax TaxID=35708 RepID=A0A0A9A2B9_ARUDO
MAANDLQYQRCGVPLVLVFDGLEAACVGWHYGGMPVACPVR